MTEIYYKFPNNVTNFTIWIFKKEYQSKLERILFWVGRNKKKRKAQKNHE